MSPEKENENSLEERILSLLGQETAHLHEYQRATRLQGEKALLLAVLEDAIGCFQKYRRARDRRGRQLFLEAEAWFMEAKDSSLFSFTSICDFLGLDPQYLRQGLRRWEEKAEHEARRPGRHLRRNGFIKRVA
ncbi:MAG TPA: hypothetical protein VNL14_12120 [Candidatus Acidoferrales bacterium]|nr:hypothetical protein [Candidatus Acidoferrales bacterium]